MTAKRTQNGVLRNFVDPGLNLPKTRLALRLFGSEPLPDRRVSRHIKRLRKVAMDEPLGNLHR